MLDSGMARRDVRGLRNRACCWSSVSLGTYCSIHAARAWSPSPSRCARGPRAGRASARPLILICASCKKVRDDEGYWQQIEVCVSAHSEAMFSHGVCPDCARRLFPDQDLGLDDGS